MLRLPGDFSFSRFENDVTCNKLVTITFLAIFVVTRLLRGGLLKILQPWYERFMLPTTRQVVVRVLS
jgi:hypothetical protein